MNKVTPLAPSFASTSVIITPPKVASPANEATPSPTRLTDLFRQELVEFGPAMMMCDTKGQVTWANAACRRINGGAQVMARGWNVVARSTVVELAAIDQTAIPRKEKEVRSAGSAIGFCRLLSGVIAENERQRFSYSKLL